MKLSTRKASILSRFILLLAAVLSIIFTVATALLEPAFNGSDSNFKYWSGLIIALLLLAIRIFYKRNSDKRKSVKSIFSLICADLSISCIAIIVVAVTIIGMIDNGFEPGIFLIQLLLLVPPIITLLDDLKDLKEGQGKQT